MVESDILFSRDFPYPDMCSPLQSQDANSPRLEHVAVHELGHTLGLSHPTCLGSLMSEPANDSVEIDPLSMRRMQIMYPPYSSGYVFPESVPAH